MKLKGRGRNVNDLEETEEINWKGFINTAKNVNINWKISKAIERAWKKCKRFERNWRILKMHLTEVKIIRKH